MKTSFKKFFGVSFEFNNKAWELSDKIRTIANKHNIRDTGSGAGFGMRDLDFEITEESDVKSFKKEVKKLKIKKLSFY